MIKNCFFNYNFFKIKK